MACFDLSISFNASAPRSNDAGSKEPSPCSLSEEDLEEDDEEPLLLLAVLGVAELPPPPKRGKCILLVQLLYLLLRLRSLLLPTLAGVAFVYLSCLIS
mmetsp:Transcript_25760/g.60156  ORF Transcript_25760/g.60156 Transcript_25760/m.60156 type:complete len:98 (-) Transcript_25760:2-295(-)